MISLVFTYKGLEEAIIEISRMQKNTGILICNQLWQKYWLAKIEYQY